MRNIEALVDNHRVAAERRATGRPIWDHVVNVSGPWQSEMPFLEKRDAIVNILRASTWAKTSPRLDEIIDGLAYSDDADEFDGWWDELYDTADADRVWINTFGGAA